MSLVSIVDPVMPVMKATRWITKEKQKKQINQPFTVSQYYRFMGGVDRMDQNIKNYKMGVRSRKWWWLIFAFTVSKGCKGWVIVRDGSFAVNCAGAVPELCRSCVGAVPDLAGYPNPISNPNPNSHEFDSQAERRSRVET